jgi:hypothetical protein
LEHPILQIKQVVNGTLMTVAPVGKFSGWFFSKELELAIDLGYDIEILKGYTYSQSCNTAVLFKEYMDALYEMRTQFPKTNALNQIAKLLGNSFYGRFGMHPLFNPTKVLNKSNFYKLIHSGDISLLKDFISLNDEFFITTAVRQALMRIRLF